jgi:hypothetical protein
MNRSDGAPKRCAIYTRKSSEEGLDQNFNSLHAQRQACEAFVKSQAGEGWRPACIHKRARCTKSQSVSSATPPSAISCGVVSRRGRLEHL